MIAIKELRDKVIAMAEEVGSETLEEQTDHYYEREIIDNTIGGALVSVTEAVEAVQYLRSLLDQEAEA